MIKDKVLFEKEDRILRRRVRHAFERRTKIYEALWQEAHVLKALPRKYHSEGMRACLRIARILNSKKS